MNVSSRLVTCTPHRIVRRYAEPKYPSHRSSKYSVKNTSHPAPDTTDNSAPRLHRRAEADRSTAKFITNHPKAMMSRQSMPHAQVNRSKPRKHHSAEPGEPIPKWRNACRLPPYDLESPLSQITAHNTDHSKVHAKSRGILFIELSYKFTTVGVWRFYLPVAEKPPKPSNFKRRSNTKMVFLCSMATG